MSCRDCGGSGRGYHNVPPSAGEHYWHDEGAKGYWSIIKPYGIAATNIALNPSVERSADHWLALGGGSTVLRTPLGAIYGNEGLQVTTTGINEGVGYEFLPQFDLITPTPYSACISIDGTPGTIATFEFAHDNVPDSDRLIARIRLPGYPVRVCAHLKATSNNTLAPTLPISVRFDRPGVYQVDGLVIVESLDPVVFYFDGDSPGGDWDGTPHDSESSIDAADRTLGDRINFNEIGFNIVSASGFGVSPRQLITTNFARLNGAHLQRVRDNPRTIALTGTFEGSPAEMHAARCDLVDALTWRFKNQCTQEATLCYSLVDDCGCQVSKELQIPVEYQAGLEGTWNTLDRERATVVFVANSEQSFSEAFDSSASFDVTSIGVKTLTIDYAGNDDAWLEVTILGSITVASIKNTTTGNEVHFGTTLAGGNPNSIPLAAGEYAILRTNPAKRISLDFYPGGTRIMHYIRYLQSQMGLFRLVPGQNVLTVDVIARDDGCRVYVRWRNRYQSVDCLGDCLGQCSEVV